MFEKMPYQRLNTWQRENCNYAKIAARLADYGCNCIHLSDDWKGADFIALHVDGETSMKVQLRGKLTIDKKYCGKSIHIAFIDREKSSNGMYVYPHDEFMEYFSQSEHCTEAARQWLEENTRDEFCVRHKSPRWTVDWL